MKKFISILTALTFAAALTVGSSAALLGDANDDGKINSADALCVLQYSVGMKVKSFNKANADVLYRISKVLGCSMEDLIEL